MQVNSALSTTFQREIASILVNDRNFATKFFAVILDDEDLRKQRIKIFSSPITSHCIDVVKKLFIESEGLLPSLGIFEQEVLELDTSSSNKENLINEYKDLTSQCHVLSPMHEKGLIDLLMLSKGQAFMNSLYRDFEAPNKELLLGLTDRCRLFSEKMDSISFTDNDDIDMSDFEEIIKQYSTTNGVNVRFDIPELCNELNGGGDTGGLSIEEVTAWLAATNDGKTMLMASIACDAVRNGNNVLFVGLEGKKLQIPMRMISNLSNIKYGKLVKFREYVNNNEDGTLSKYFDQDEIKRIRDAQKLYGEKVSMIHAIKNCEIEKLEATITEKFKHKHYMMTIIDYGQLIESVQQYSNTDLLLAYVFRKLEKLASNLKTSINVPMQTNRSGMSELKADFEKGEEYPTYKMSQVAGGYSALKTCGCVISLSRTEQERKDGKIRLRIEKQREGLVHVHVGIQADFEYCNLTRGERYYVDSPGNVNTSNKPLSISNLGLDTTNESVIEKVNSINILREISSIKRDEVWISLASRVKAVKGLSLRLAFLREELDNVTEENDVQALNEEIKALENDLFDKKYSEDPFMASFLEIFKTKYNISDFIISIDQVITMTDQLEIEYPILLEIMKITMMAQELELLNELD